MTKVLYTWSSPFSKFIWEQGTCDPQLISKIKKTFSSSFFKLWSKWKNQNEILFCKKNIITKIVSPQVILINKKNCLAYFLISLLTLQDLIKFMHTIIFNFICFYDFFFKFLYVFLLFFKINENNFYLLSNNCSLFHFVFKPKNRKQQPNSITLLCFDKIIIHHLEIKNPSF